MGGAPELKTSRRDPFLTVFGMAARLHPHEQSLAAPHSPPGYPNACCSAVIPVWACRKPCTEIEQKKNIQRGLVVAVKTLPAIVACTGAVVRASENSSPEALLTLRLKTGSGDEVLLPLSEQATRQLQKVVAEFNRTRDLLFVEARAAASATLQ
jgi:hypothetical protein